MREERKFRNAAGCFWSSHFRSPHTVRIATDLQVFEVLLGSSGGRHVGMQYEMKFYLLSQYGGEHLPCTESGAGGFMLALHRLCLGPLLKTVVRKEWIYGAILVENTNLAQHQRT